MNRLSLQVIHRLAERNVGALGGSKTERFSFDFVVDGSALSTLVQMKSNDMIGALGWLPSAANDRVAQQLLLAAPPPVPGGRQMLYVCPECGDLSCGAITCEVVRDGSVVEWRRFGYENDYDESMSDFASFAEIGPFRFDWESYRAVVSTGLRASAG